MSTPVPFFFGIRFGRHAGHELHLRKERVPFPPEFVRTLDRDAEEWLPPGRSLSRQPEGVVALHQERVSGDRVWHLLGIWDRSADRRRGSKAIWIAEAPFTWEDIRRDWPHEARRVEDHLGKLPQLPREHNVSLYEDVQGLICGFCGYPARRGDVGWVHILPWDEGAPAPSIFDLAMTWLHQAEGGYVDHEHDAGGATRWGISSASYPDIDLTSLTWEDARAIYRRDYWEAYLCAALPPALGIALLDAVVLHGRLGVVYLQRALGVADDGVIAPLTLAAARERSGDPEVLRDFLALRGVLLASQGAEEITNFGRGWMLRLFRLADYIREVT